MPFPIIPLIAILAIFTGSGVAASGLYALRWYRRLSKEKQAEADAEANRLAEQWYGLPLDQLDADQARAIVDDVHPRFKS